jgi:2,3-bisphosphoglycerate-dependent phosphoglycerate mutase
VNAWPVALTLVRHGESLGNLANEHAYATKAEQLDLAVGDPSVELSPLGARQAMALGKRLGDLPPRERPTAVLVSPYVRAQQTADHLLATAGLEHLPRRSDERLRDREQGLLDTLTWYGVRKRYPEEAERRAHLGKFWYRPPGGESWADVGLRTRDLLRDVRADFAGERLLVVCHDVPILMHRYVLEDLTPAESVALSGQVRNCSQTIYRRADHGGNDTALHLDVFNDVAPVERDPAAEVTAHE